MKIWIFSLIALMSAGICCAQTAEEKEKIKKKTRVSELKQIAEKSAREYEQKLKRISKPNTGKPSTPGQVDDQQRIIMDVDKNGNPIYLTPLDSDGNAAVKAPSLYTGGSLGLSVNGEGMTAGVWDDGSVRATHISLEGRAVNLNTSSAANHATFVAGQIAATDIYSPMRTYGKAAGIAPKANIRAYDGASDESEVATEIANGLIVSNHSYGSSSGSYYSSTARAFDNLSYLAPYYVSVWAAGNANIPTGTDQINLFATGKNSIAVASTAQLAAYTGPGSVVRAGLSSRGPSDDGRIKPDIAANGESVSGIMASADNAFINTTGGGTGTSFAAPTVTGALLLLQQHYNNLNSQFMLGSTVKGLMLHTAAEAGSNPGPDITFGWGFLDVEKAANVITNNGGKSAILEDSLRNGTTFSRELVASGTEPLVATICWTDTAATAVLLDNNDPTRKLINDLDLRLAGNSSTYYPWKLDSTNYNGAALQGDNIRDNIEKIEIPNPVAGQTYTLTVSHKNTLYKNGQWFSVIISGLQECVANRTILSGVSYPSLDQQQASATITAKNTISNGGKAIYHAGDEVLLKDGFTGLAGSEVRAYLEGCTNDYNARTASMERTVVTYPATSSVENVELPDNAVYPNPGNGIFKVNLNGIPSGKVEITGTDGKAMFDRSFKKQSEMEVDIRNSTPGIYILRVVSDQKVLTKKILKK